MLGASEDLGRGPAQARLAAEDDRGNGGNLRAGGAPRAILEYAPIGTHRSGDTKPAQPYGEEARDYLEHLIGGKIVRVDTYGPDKYKRVVAVVWDARIIVNLLWQQWTLQRYTEAHPAKFTAWS